MQQAYFVSDIHLKSLQEANAKIFIRFLRSLAEDGRTTHLFLLGDIFDLWIGDHAFFIQKFHVICEVLTRLVNKGIEVHYFEGNHDLYLKRYWQDRIGLQVHSKAEYFRINHLVIRAEHGDLIDKDDKGYLFLKSILQTKIIRLFAEKAPEKFISWLGSKASEASRDYTTKTKTISDELVVEKIREHAIHNIKNKYFDYLIGGHLHVRDEFEFTQQDHLIHSINLGSWMKNPCTFLINENRQEFMKLI